MNKIKYTLCGILLFFATILFNLKLNAVEEISYDYNYTGSYQEFTAPYSGQYSLEVWGAGGGGQHQAGQAGIGGLGGYSKGTINLKKGDKLYIYVGGAGTACVIQGCTAPATFNGGGSGYKKKGDANDPVGSGGGATDIRFKSGAWNDSSSLLSRVIVAGGGGGGGMETNEHGGDGGGLTGTRYNNSYGAPGTQTKGWAFGIGFSASPSTINYVNTTWGGSGGGGGWYGGYNSAGSGWHGAGGGSGFIWTSASETNIPANYSVDSKYYLKDAETLAGNQTMPKIDGSGTMKGNRDAGHAKIKLVKLSSPIDDVSFPIYSDDIDFEAYYDEGKVDIEVTIPSSPLNINIKYDTDLYIWGHNVGNVTLKDGETLQVVLMNREGEISIYNIKSTLGTAKLTNVIFEKGSYEFQSDVYEYDFTVSYDVKTFDPTITAPSGVNYQMTDGTLNVGENIIKIKVTGDNLKSSTYKFKITRSYRETASPTIETFKYTANTYQEFTAPYTGDYLLEVWGASGQGNNVYSDGGNVGAPGRGGYSKGTVRLTAGEKLYIYIGGTGSYRNSVGTVAGGYNGGGYARKTTSDHWTVFSGGGGTDMRLVSGVWNDSSSLLSRIIVAGGGGGASMLTGAGGYGGGLTGGNGITNSSIYPGGTQTNGGGTGASFGKGADSEAANGMNASWGSSGAGGGWYGGAIGGWGSAGGGSGYVWTEKTKTSAPSGYIPTEKYYLENAETIAGNQAVPNYNSPGTTMTGNVGNGFARITYYNPEDLDEITNITVDKGQITPAFNPKTYEYDVILNLEDTYITINAETLKGEGLITGSGTYEVPSGQNDFQITFTNTQGEIKTYTLHISRPASADATLKGFKVNGILYENFDPDVTEYEIEIPTEIEKINLELLKSYPGQKIPENTIYDFTESTITKTIIVESEGTTSQSNKIYTFTFNRKKTSELRSLTLSTGTLNKIFSPKITEYELSIYNYIREIPIEAIPYFEEAKVKIVENRYVGINDSEITITVDLDGVPSTTYTLNIKRIEPVLEPVDEGYNYTGDYQEFTAPASAFYTLEVWGASGGGNNLYSDGGNAGSPGRGGYSKGTVYLTAGEKLYIYVGSQGTYRTSSAATVAGGYNGGGSATKKTSDHWTVFSGGGATDIRFASGNWNDASSLLSRLIVAGGGGGASMLTGYGGSGGGLTGTVSNQFSASAGSQTSGARGASFGKGADSSSSTNDNGWGSSGGGGGWYGGGTDNWGAGAGGSGFIWTKEYAKNVPNGYSVDSKYYLKDAETIAGTAKMPTHDGTNLMTGNLGNGFARITSNPGIVGDTFLDNILIDKNPDLLEFYPWELTYEVTLPKEYSEVLIEATPKSNEAKILGTGTIKLKPGQNEHKIIVTTEDGANKTYTLNITREPSDDSVPLDILLKNPQVYLCGMHENYCKYTFDPSITEYDITIPYETEQITFEAVLKSEYQTVKYYTNDESDDGTKNRIEITNGIYNLHNGLNNIEIDITSEDKAHTTTYIYRIMKDDSGNNNLQTLIITDPQTELSFNPYIYEYFINIPSNYDKIELTIETQNPKATYKVENNENLKTGMNDIKIIVASPNGNEKTYVLHVFKEQSTNTFLSSLTITDDKGTNIEYTPTFQKVLTEYSAVVPNNVESVTITAVPEEGTVTNLSNPYTLTSGTNEINITVTSTSGDVQVYKINIYKAKNNNSNLANLEVENYTLNPTFDKDTKIYNITVPKSVTSLNITATPEVNTTTCITNGENDLTKTYNTVTVTCTAEDKSYTIYEIRAEKETDTNNYLKNIIVEGGSLNETFNKETLNYTIDVTGETTNIKIMGEAESEYSKVTGNGTYALLSGPNIITLTVTSEDKNERTYQITVNRSLNDDLTLKSVTNSLKNEVTENIDPSKPYDYIINVQYEVTEITVDGIANSKTSIVTGGGKINLQPGENEITLRVTSEAGNHKDYKVKIIRDLSNNDDLSFLYVHEGTLTPEFNETTIFYDVLIPNDKTELTIEALPEDKNATVEIKGNTKDLEVGKERTIEIVVTAQNGETKTYTINAIRQEYTAEDLTLINLETDKGALSPIFSPNTHNYELTVEHEDENITVTATPNNAENVIIKGNGVHKLKVGKNIVGITVISKETNIELAYQIVVTRKVSNNASLKSLIVKSHALSPTFNSETTEYTLTTSQNSLEFTTIAPVLEDATYQITGNENFVSGENIVTITVTAPDGITTKDYIIKVNKARSKNNNLSFLEVVDQTLTPPFHKGVTFYAVDVPRNTNSIIINATKEDETSTVEGTGLKTLNSGENYFNIEVTSEAGTKKTYTILVTKEASDNNYLSSLYTSIGSLNPVFNKETNTYNLTVPYYEDEISISGTQEESTSTVTGFKTYNLNYGKNEINIIVTSESGNIRTYQINVTREPLISAYLTDLTIPNYELDEEFNKLLLEYYISVDYEITSITPSYTTEDPNANVTITGNNNLKVGMNEVHIKVTSSDNTLENDYIIYVNRKMSTNNFLSLLAVDGYIINPTFNPEELIYNLTVPREVETVNIIGITEDASATITSGIGNHNLELGLNTIEIKVKSMIGIVRTYKINITREQSNNNYLQNLTVSYINNNFELNPEFNKMTNDYTISAPSDANFVVIKGSLEDENATISGTGTKELNSGLNHFEIIVTAEDGSVNIYNIDITKEISNNNNLLNLIPSEGTLNPVFDKDTLEYTLELEYEVEMLSFTATPESNLSTVKGTEVSVVPEGNSTRLIMVTAEDGNIKTYKINIIKETASNALLESLTIEGYEFEFDPNTFTYNIQVSRGKSKLTEEEITAVAKDANATVNLMGDINLIPDMINIYTIEVIAKDGYTTQNYILNITRDSEEYSLRSEVYEIIRKDGKTEETEVIKMTEDYTIGAMPSTEREIYKSNFLNPKEYLKMYKEDGSEITDEKTFTMTGGIIKLEINNYVYDELRIIIRGDITKDGKVNVTDKTKLTNFIIKTTTLDVYEQLAADVTKDGKVNVTDKTKLTNFIIKLITDLN